MLCSFLVSFCAYLDRVPLAMSQDFIPADQNEEPAENLGLDFTSCIL